MRILLVRFAVLTVFVGATAPAGAQAVYTLLIGGQQAGMAADVTGGGYVIQPAQTVGGAYALGPVVTMPLSFSLNLPPSNHVISWLNSTVLATHPENMLRTGSLGVSGAKYDFTNAFISEVTIPAMDVAATEPELMRISILPNTAVRPQVLSGGGTRVTTSPSIVPKVFRLELAGLESKAVRRIDAFTIRVQNVAHAGQPPIPGDIAYSPLRAYLELDMAGPWLQWAQTFADGGEDVKNGSLIMMDDRGRVVLRTLLVNVRPRGLSGIDSSDPKRVRVVIDLAPARMEFSGT
jgi:hypothetical protein